MGNQDSSRFEADFREAYAFIQLVEDPIYGLVKIYRKRQINYDYVMVYEESLDGLTREQVSELLRQLSGVQSHPHDQLLRLFHCRLVEENPMQCQSQYLRLYLEYFNFTLQNLIDSNARTRVYLDAQEVAYIVNSAVSVAKHLAKMKVPWLSIQASQIVLSTTGCIYFSPVRLFRSSVSLDLCGGCTILPSRYEKNLQSSPAKDLRHELKRLVLDLTQNCPKGILHRYQPILDEIQVADGITDIALPVLPGQSCTINMMKHIYKRNNDSESENMSEGKDLDLRSETASHEHSFKQAPMYNIKYNELSRVKKF